MLKYFHGDGSSKMNKKTPFLGKVLYNYVSQSAAFLGPHGLEPLY